MKTLIRRLLGHAPDDAAAAGAIREIWRTAMDVTLAQGGTLSHHHGAGLARLPYVRAALGTSWDVLASVKAALDPLGLLNPGKLALGTAGRAVAGPIATTASGAQAPSGDTPER